MTYIPTWISIEDGLPTAVDTYIVYCTQRLSNHESQKFIRLAYFVNGFETESNIQVTHWMKIPDAPKD